MTAGPTAADPSPGAHPPAVPDFLRGGVDDIRHIGVVIPAHDEDELIVRCLTAVAAARDAVERCCAVTVDVVVVLDDCSDATAEVVARHPGVRVLELDARSVGTARAAGVDAVLAASAVATSHTWLASTDADSCVPVDWLVTQVRLAGQGTDVVIGTVRPDPADLTPEQLAAWRRTRVPGRPNGHVHGANLGVRAATYLQTGGFDPHPVHEDVDLVARARQLAGVRVVATDVIDVLTSGRQVGRAPGGYARYLREDLVPHV